MAKYRKKPVSIDAEQWFPGKVIMGVDNHGDYAVIHTMEGAMHVKSGDWVITGVKGERYACDNEIFRMTYEAVWED